MAKLMVAVPSSTPTADSSVVLTTTGWPLTPAQGSPRGMLGAAARSRAVLIEAPLRATVLSSMLLLLSGTPV